ncbi:EspB family ESX-1 secretion system-associated protein [Mycobacterium sp. ML4]
MTQPQTVTVDQQEILDRANEVEAPMGDPPTDVPVAPCALTCATNATEQIRLNAENMRTFLEAGARERSRLATSLRNAAKAYGDVDEEGAAALDNDGGEVTGESAGGAGGDSSAGLQDTEQVAAAGDAGYTDLETAAKKIETGDQGLSLYNVSDAWNKFSFALQGDVKRFRIFQKWEGDAATACEESLEQQRQWIVYMSENATALAQQAYFMAKLQDYAKRAHPSSADIAALKKMVADGNKEAIKVYAEYQQTSEKVLEEYDTKSAQVKAFNLKKPPPAIKIDPPPPAQTPGLIPPQVMQAAAMAGGGSGSGMQAPMMSPMGGAGTGGGMPAGVGAELAAARDAAANLPKEPGMKPMSLGGGGGGGGMPSMPLAPATGGIEGESMRPAGAGDLGAAGAAGAAGRGAAAGGGMGMPMGGHGQGGGGSKSKGAQQDEEALYTEDRAWTEAVIGQRRRQDMKESK